VYQFLRPSTLAAMVVDALESVAEKVDDGSAEIREVCAQAYKQGVALVGDEIFAELVEEELNR